MKPWVVEYVVSRTLFFCLGLGLLAVWETVTPWRPWLINRRLRWLRHFSLALMAKIFARVLFPFFTVSVAVWAQQKGIGILDKKFIPSSLQIILSFIGLDFFIYLQHRLLHKYHFLWRIHRVHHMDRQLDVSTGLRFHPFEEAFTTGVKTLAIMFLGASPLAVLIFEIWLGLATLFTHLNVRLSHRKDMALRKILVTPGMHRIHHSDIPEEFNSNYGFCFSWWDKLFGTYQMIPSTGERKLTLGLEDYREPKYQTLENMLLTPFNLKKLKIRKKKYRATKLKVTDKLAN